MSPEVNMSSTGNSSELSAWVQHSFSRGFALDEGRIRKIHDLICKRLPASGAYPDPRFKVYLADSSSYTTLSVRDILSEDNDEYQRIERITVSVDDDRLHFLLDFDQGKTDLSIDGVDRDVVFLLYTDLGEYLSSEINTRRRVSSRSVRDATMLAGLCFFALSFLFYVLPEMPARSELASLVGGTDVNAKLNYLLTSTVEVGSLYLPMLGWLFLMLLAISVESRIFRRLVHFFVPSDVFLFGHEIERQAKADKLRSNLMWGVAIALAISLVSGLFVWYLTR